MFAGQVIVDYVRALVAEEQAALAPLQAEITALRNDLRDERVVRYTYLKKKLEAIQKVIGEQRTFADQFEDSLHHRVAQPQEPGRDAFAIS